MPHDHSHHGHSHVAPGTGDRRLLGAIVVNGLLTVAQIVGGLMSGSLALVADAIHNLSDAMSLVIAYAARRIARRPADAAMTFGYARAESVAALINYTTLIVIGLYLVWEAVLRLAAPQPVEGWTVVILAGIAFVVDAATVALTFAMSKESQNIRAAFVHNVADMMGSVAVIVAGALILLYDWRLADPLATLLIAAYILWHALSEIGGVIRLLMLGTPPALDPHQVLEAMNGVEGVDGIHHLHLFLMDEHTAALEAHVRIAPGAWGEADAIKTRLRDVLHARFDLGHTTLELECTRHGCTNPAIIGHG